MSNLLPPNATASEIALDDSTARLSVVVDVEKLWNVATCPAALLPWLAWSLSVDEWKDDWSETVKRSVIAASYEIHSHKGTPYSIKKALLAMGYDNVIIRESRVDYYNGVYRYDGTIDYGSNSTWPLFDVIVNIGYIPDSATIAEIRARIEHYKNERSVLRNLVFMNILYNNTIVYNGAYNFNGGVL
jgi:phage tail P2-like protein